MIWETIRNLSNHVFKPRYTGSAIARTYDSVRNDSATHETVLLDCTTEEAGSAIQ